LIKAKLSDVETPDVTVSFNTDSIRKTKLNSTAPLLTFAIFQKPFIVYVDGNGKVLRLEGCDEVVQQSLTNWQTSASIQQEVKQNGQYFPFKRMFLELPKERLGYRSTWTNNNKEYKYRTNYEVTAIRGALLDITSADSAKTSQGKYILNTANGLLESATVVSKQYWDKKLQQNNYTQGITYGSYTKQAVDTAWINMAATLSWFSDAFIIKTGTTDSAKLYSYFSRHDAMFNNDTYYTLSKLNLIQQGGENSYKKYDTLLSKTPAKLLAGEPSHLFNKMHSAIGLSADTAYDVVNYFYKEKMFGDWLQETYALMFVPRQPVAEDEDWKKEMRNHGFTEKEISSTIEQEKHVEINRYLLLDKMHNDKNIVLQQKITALYLWVSAEKQKNDLKLLVKTATKFNRLNDDYMKAGNGGRYGLLLYTLLNNAGKKNLAGQVMDKTIGDLERYVADTLNANRYADKNILAHAYFLKYQAEWNSDSVKALQYLAKAAQNSPVKANEKAYVSFYDRVILNSKESYLDDYMNKLFEHGDNETALKVFADYVTSNFDRLNDMQKLYESRFPGKSFKEFVTNHVISTWQDAPGFVLKGIDGMDHCLADYKGKWVVADFWGTWCSPCREEMPRVNAYNTEINEGKHKGIVLVSIACSDNAPNVKKFLAENKYAMTVIMGDDPIIKRYHIQFYPSKVLISPDGKMLLTSTGSDWVGIVEKFNELYAAN
jgi:thiol-disulfide isomerase/thioredoxin